MALRLIGVNVEGDRRNGAAECQSDGASVEGRRIPMPNDPDAMTQGRTLRWERQD